MTGFACTIPVGGRHIFEPSIQMRNRGNGKGGGIAACGLVPKDLDVSREILENDYVEPDETPVFGCESSESGVSRTDWDDVDDYHLWSATPPQDRSGTVLPNSTGWQRDVVVEWVDPSDPASTVGGDQGVKRVTVTVQRYGKLLAQVVHAIRMVLGDLLSVGLADLLD